VAGAYVSGRTRRSIQPNHKIREFNFMLDANLRDRYLHRACSLRNPGDPLIASKCRQTPRDSFVQRGRRDFDGV
jgi:hypothetical protein